MEKISPTRMNLLDSKEQMKLAGEGVELLKSKRGALMKEFFNIMDSVISSRSDLIEKMQEATDRLNLARAYLGSEALNSVASASQRDIVTEIVKKSVWGISFSEIQAINLIRSSIARGYSPFGESLQVDDVSSKFEKVLNVLIRIASGETRLKKIGEAIRKTTMRINAIEQIILPGLKMQIHVIEGVLEERERENIFRLKRLKD